jgi:NAD(P)-dependent dehydrogenase (short-subunit alcohol dehydrogenase family)
MSIDMALPDEFRPLSGDAPIALVTGGAKRVGRALAEALAARGFRIALHFNRSRPEAEAAAAAIDAAGHAKPILVQADLLETDAPARILADLPAAPVLLVNNASIFIEDSFGRIDLDVWRQHMAINLLAPVLLSQAFARALPRNRNGLIVNLSDAKLSSPNPDFFSYTISKTALAGATDLMARTLAPNVRVNAIAPSVTLVSGPQSRANFEEAHVMNALGRGVDVSDLVRALLYLVETPTVTGQTLVIDAGQRFLALPRDVAYMARP